MTRLCNKNTIMTVAFSGYPCEIIEKQIKIPEDYSKMMIARTKKKTIQKSKKKIMLNYDGTPIAG